MFSGGFYVRSCCVWPYVKGYRNRTQYLHTFYALLTSWKAYCMVENAYTGSFWCRVEAMSFLSCTPGAHHLDITNTRNVTQLHLSCTPKPFYVGLSSIYRASPFVSHGQCIAKVHYPFVLRTSLFIHSCSTSSL